MFDNQSFNDKIVQLRITLIDYFVMTESRSLSNFSLKEKESYIYNALIHFKMNDLAETWKQTISPLISISDDKEFGVTEEKNITSILEFLQSIRIELLTTSKHVTSKTMSEFFKAPKISHIIARIFCEDLQSALTTKQIINFHMDEGTTVLTVWS